MLGKRKRIPLDAQWCINNNQSLSLKIFAKEFGLGDRSYATNRYTNILTKYFGVSERTKLVKEMEGWKKSVDQVDFWKEQKRNLTLAKARAVCSSYVNNLILEQAPSESSNNSNSNSNSNNDNNNSINPESTVTSTLTLSPFIIKHLNVTDAFKEYQQYISSHYSTFTIEKDLQEIMATADILFLAPDDHSECKKKVFRLSNLDLMCTEMLQEIKIVNTQEDEELFNDEEFMKVTRIINEVTEKTKTTKTARLELLTLAASMEISNKASVIEGVSNLLTKLPRVEILNMDRLGEVELQSTYYDALLSTLIADQDKNVALRWPNKSTDKEQTDIRPDAIVSTVMQHDFGYPIVSLDVLRLGIASKRAIDKWKLNSCLAFMINGFDLTFFITKKQHKNCYTMLEIAQFTSASSLSNLHSFVSLMNLNKLTKVARCFWNECHAINAGEDDEAETLTNDDAGIIPISEIYALINKTYNRTLGTSTKY
ncbi:hypothetical protein BDC45DRAFT_529201 [Circinella umbellata]|nr:hypothetical protein BDC45DRAFT_529201 [Circinella umbellata]